MLSVLVPEAVPLNTIDVECDPVEIPGERGAGCEDFRCTGCFGKETIVGAEHFAGSVCVQRIRGGFITADAAYVLPAQAEVVYGARHKRHQPRLPVSL